MNPQLTLKNFDREYLTQYLVRQIHNVIPDGLDPTPEIEAHIDEALGRLHVCINAIKCWPQNTFDSFHSTQYCTFVYYLANTIWRRTHDPAVPLRLFLLNKALNGIDCFYEIELPEVFFIGHSVGIVLAKASYGNHLVLYQNCTVGKNHGTAPILEDGVILYPNSTIIGNCRVRQGSVIAQGVSVINRDTEPNRIAFQGSDGTLVFKSSGHNILSDFFRDT
jgi:serine O-acetyltransferase